MARRLLLLTCIVGLLVAAATAACGVVTIGDPSHVAYLHNSTNRAVLVYEVARSDRVFDARVEADTTVKTSWLISKSSSTKRTVEAYDEAGVLVFCRRYSYEELQRIGWRIEIVAGQNTCS